ncbi:MAG: hypothetical protein JWM99_3613 [Verrucomicrobiales bacterium]|nr:hypothetical protein [Verrucomicrobiales bacterium]
MKTLRTSRAKSGEEGAVLLTSLVITAILGIGLGSYLRLASSQYRATAWSANYNALMPAIEAGCEEALTQVYRHPTNLNADAWGATTNLALSNSIVLTNRWYTKSRTFGQGRYVAAVSSAIPPEIIVQAYFLKPETSIEMARSVRLTTVGGALFAKGMVAKANVGWVGNILSDSFDSKNTNYSVNGLYSVAKRHDQGSVASVNGTISLGGGVIYGGVATGPVGSVSGGRVGDAAYIAAGTAGIQSGHYVNNLNISFPDVAAPWAGGVFAPPAGTGTNSSYTHVLQSGNYQLSSISNGEKMLVLGQAVLYVTGSIDMQGQSQITVGSGGALNLYVGGSCDLGGNGVVNNNNDATTFALWGLPTCTSITMHGNAAFTGTIYAPEANYDAGGGGNNTYDCVGAVIVNSVSMNGHFQFHYDENLGRSGPFNAYVLNSWNEIWNEL